MVKMFDQVFSLNFSFFESAPTIYFDCISLDAIMAHKFDESLYMIKFLLVLFYQFFLWKSG